MISEDGRDEIVSAVERRKIKLERELVTAPYEGLAEDIQACRRLLVMLAESPCRPRRSSP
jgi:hypothetical protein